MDDINREKLMGAEREKSIRWREKGAKQDCRLEEQMIGGEGGGWGTKTENHHEKAKALWWPAQSHQSPDGLPHKDHLMALEALWETLFISHSIKPL